jgi:hypothetical protein
MFRAPSLSRAPSFMIGFSSLSPWHALGRLRKFEPVFRFLPLQCQICILYIFAHTYMYASLGSSSSAGSAAGAAGAEQILVVTAFLCVQALALSLSPPRSGSMLPEMS